MMAQRIVTSMLGVVIGMFATFAVFGSIVGVMDRLFLVTQGACSFGHAGSPERFTRVAIYTDDGVTPVNRRTRPEDVDWQYAYDMVQDQTNVEHCQIHTRQHRFSGAATFTIITPTGELITWEFSGTKIFGPMNIGDGIETTVPDLYWVPPEGIFTAQQELVTLLAVIAVIGMPLGAMTAIVYFGQAMVSSAASEQSPTRMVAAVAAVIIILLGVQLFQQFAGYLGDSFDAVDGDRHVVFNEPLGGLAETVVEFWGVLAFAGLINIATIVWRNYNGIGPGGLTVPGGGGNSGQGL